VHDAGVEVGKTGANAGGTVQRGSNVRKWGQRPPTKQQLDLNHELHSCENVEQLLVVIEKAKARRVLLNTVNIITAINKIAKYKDTKKQQRVKELLQDVLLRSLATRLATNPADIGCREIATLAWSLNKLKVDHNHDTLWSTLEQITVTRGFKEFTPRSLSTLIWALAAAGRRPQQVLHKLDTSVELIDWSLFDWRCLSTLHWSLASLGHGRVTDGARGGGGMARPLIFARLEAEIIGMQHYQASERGGQCLVSGCGGDGLRQRATDGEGVGDGDAGVGGVGGGSRSGGPRTR